MKIFVTGIAGFIGSSLAKHLLTLGHYVKGIDNYSTGNPKNLDKRIECKDGDIRDSNILKELLNDYDIIIHLAAQTSGEKSFEIPEYDIETNIIGSLNIYEFSKICNAKLIINISSMSVYGNVTKNKIISEDYITNPISVYGNTKLTAENILGLLSKRDNIPLINLRLFNAFGPGQNLDEMKQGMISIYLSYLLKYDEITVKGSLKRVRDFIYIDDIISSIVSIINSDKYETNTFNISTGTLTSVSDVIKILKSISGIDKPIVQSDNTPGDIFGFGGSYKKIKQEFDWDPKYSLEHGIKTMMEFYKGK
jgi:UDP-glucose 4-epimerase